MAKILLVEDEKNLRELYSKHLRLKKYVVETAVDGAEALVKAGTFRPDIIVLDIVLPELNGVEVLETLKADPEFKNIPVLMLTGVSEVTRIKQCLEIGAMGYIVKGSSADEITEKVNLIIGASRYMGS